MAKLRVKRKAYKRKDGTHVKATTYMAVDKGKPGRTPKKGRWFSPKVHSGWNKDDPSDIRRRRVLRAHGGDLLAAARSKQALANVTTDPATKRAASSDAKYFFSEYRKKRGGG